MDREWAAVAVEYPWSFRNKIKCWITTLITPRTRVAPTRMSQKLALPTYVEIRIEEDSPLGPCWMENGSPSGNKHISAGVERVIQSPTGNSTIKIIEPAISNA